VAKLNSAVGIENKIDILLNASHINKPLHLWINGIGPCIVANGDVCREIELEHTPLISVVTPVFASDLNFLKETVKSVLDQIYTEWELCIVDDGTNNTELIQYLHSLKDPKIKIKVNRKNRGISEATNIAIGMATGEYVCFLDHDDLLTRDALLEVVTVINKSPEVKFIYSDEDKVTGEGELVEPFYKPDWSYNLLLSQNYTCHLSTYSTSILRQLGGVRRGFEGSQDYDLVLRYIEVIKESEIAHIPRVLYHWRRHEHSTASGVTIKPYAHINALRAISDHLKRKNEIGALVTVGRYLGTNHVEYVLDRDIPVNIIIPTRDNPVYLKTCCFSILQSTYRNYSVTIVDNGSKKNETKKLLKELCERPNFMVLSYNKPFNYSAINNYAVKKGFPARLLLFLNDDTEVITKDWMEQLIQHVGRNGVAVAGAKLLYSNGTLQHAGVIIGIGGVAGHSHKRVPDALPGYFSRPHIIHNVSAVTGACMMVDTKVFMEVGGFEEKLPKAFNDIDLCLKIRARGYKIVYNPYACLFHHESVSRGLDNYAEAEFAKAIYFMQKKWDCKNFKDPYYNSNLTLVDENFSYKIG